MESLRGVVTTLRARMSRPELAGLWRSCASRLGCCQGRPAVPGPEHPERLARRRPAPAGPTSVGSGDGHLSSRHAPKAHSSPPDPGALGDRLDRPLDADVRDRLHGAARDRVPDGADAHRRMAAERPDRREYTRMWQEKSRPSRRRRWPQRPRHPARSRPGVR